MVARADADQFTARKLEAINGMMLDMLLAVDRKDYEVGGTPLSRRCLRLGRADQASRRPRAVRD